MNDIVPERAILAAQAACPFPLDLHAPLPEGLARLQSEFVLADQSPFGSPGVLVTNLRFCGQSTAGWNAYLLRDVGEVAWKENRLPLKRGFGGVLSRLMDGPPKREHPGSGTVDLTLRNGASIRFVSRSARSCAEAIATLAKSARSLTG